MKQEVNYDDLLLRRDLRELFENAEFTAALICHYYPMYSLESVNDMNEGDVQQLLRAAQTLEITRNIQHLTNLAAAQSKAGFTKVMNTYQSQLKELGR